MLPLAPTCSVEQIFYMDADSGFFLLLIVLWTLWMLLTKHVSI